MNENTVECPNCGHLNEMKEEAAVCKCSNCKEGFDVFVRYEDHSGIRKKGGDSNAN